MSKNPFSISFGTEPLNYVDRINEKKQIIDDISEDFPVSHAYIITGPRGSGKTVFMTSIANELSKKDDWIVIDPGPKNNLLENVASELYESAKSKFHFLKTEFSFSFKGLTFSLSGEKPVSTVNTLLKKMLEVLNNKNIKVLITIDEVDNSNDMKFFIQEFQSLIRQNFKIRLLMTGLYENVSRLQNDKTLTFLYRARKINLSPLFLASISSQYKEYLECDEETAIKLAKITKGYAFAFQLLGYILYKDNKKDIDNESLMLFDQYLAEYVYDKIYFDLTVNEQKLLKGLQSDESVEVKIVKSNIKMNDNNFNVYKTKLIKLGLLAQPAYGMVVFTLPRFKDFLLYK